MNQIYLDHNATTPIAAEVAEAMKPYLSELFGNPSSPHVYGSGTKIAVESARAKVADLLECDTSEIIFTSGGTESNNMALKGVAYARKNQGNHIITSSIEHPAVIEVCKYLESQGFQITYLPVDRDGMVNPAELEQAIRKDTILVSIMHANNEVGTIQPIREIADITTKYGILLHTDAAQSLGKIETSVKKLGVDLMSIAGHKFYAPKGIGALYVRSGVTLEKLIHGADHEQNMRAGTENIMEISGFGKACELVSRDLAKNIKHYSSTRNRIEELLLQEIPEAKINGHPDKRLPNTLSISFPGIEANTLVSRLESIAISAGAACHSEHIDVSAVLKAMNVPIEYAMGTVRISTGNLNSIREAETAARVIIAKVRELMPDKPSSIMQEADTKTKFKLTKYTHGLGCACKIQPSLLQAILNELPSVEDKNVLVGTETSDDAAVYLVGKDIAIVQSLDFFTPIVDDPYEFGSIAAANALSDIYAMGASPLFAMNIVGFPEKTLPLSVLEEILKGASDKAAEAGIPIIGGHTIEDPEPKYGMVATGTIHPQKIIRNVGAKPGDQLILTKPIGTGILTTALKRGLLEADKQNLLIKTMQELNKIAAEVMSGFEVHACTDITGFGLLGHLSELSTGSGCDVEIDLSMIPLLPGTREMATAGIVPGGTYNNLEYVTDKVDFGKIGKTDQLILADAQTSGGLLIALPKGAVNQCLEKLKKAGLEYSAIIGSMTGKGEGRIKIT